MKSRAALVLLGLAVATPSGCASAPSTAPAPVPSPGRVHVFRLRPKQDLAQEIQRERVLRTGDQPAATEPTWFSYGLFALEGRLTEPSWFTCRSARAGPR